MVRRTAVASQSTASTEDSITMSKTKISAKKQPKSVQFGFNSTEEEEEVASRSCLAFRFKKSPKSTASRAPLMTDTPDSRQGSFNDTYAHSWESFHRKQNEIQREAPAPINTPSTAASSVQSLLTPPAPKDRTNRAQYEREQRRRGIYEGEMEPEGRRGQEAQPAVESPPLPSQRKDYVKTSLQILAPLSQGSSSSDDNLQQIQADLQPAEESPAPLQITSSGRAVRLGNNNDERTGKDTPPPLQRYVSDVSTQSDDDIRYMMSDLVPSQDLAAPSTPLARELQNMPETPSPGPAAEDDEDDEEEDDDEEVVASPLTATYDVHALNALAMEHVHNGEYDMALRAFTRVLQIQIKLYGDIHPAVASAHHNLGTLHAKRAAILFDGSAQQRHVRALALASFQAAARTARDSLGRNHPNVAVSLVRIGFLLLQSRQYHNAIVTFKEALRIRLAHYGGRHGLVANLYNNLGVCHMHLGSFEQGREYLDAALDVQRDIVAEEGEDRTDRLIHQLELADTLFNIGGLCLEWIRRQGPDARRAVDAEEAFAEALEIRTRVLGPDDQMVLQVKALLDMARAVPRPRSRQSPSPKPPRPDRLKSYRPVPTLNQTRSGSTRSPRSTPSEPPTLERMSLAGHSPPGRAIPTNRPSDERTDESLRVTTPHDDSVFRASQSAPTEGIKLNMQRKTREVPFLQVSVSKDEDDGNVHDGPRIFVTPHLVPSSPVNAKNVSEEVVANPSLLDSFVSDRSTDLEDSGRIEKSYSYDAEENCMIADKGIDSDLGRVHFPLSWSKDTRSDQDGPQHGRTSIMVARPFRGNTRGPGGPGREGNDTIKFSSGNKDRDDVMYRAKALLKAHGSFTDDDQVQQSSPDSQSRRVLQANESRDRTNVNLVRNNTFDQELEDGIAPLGGAWPTRNRSVAVSEMLNDPMNHLVGIHEEAARQLKHDNAVDALLLFETVLRCQRRKHGHLNPDVAAALHNVGIAQLRAQNYSEALKAFEEASRIRKGSLGREHPQVAVSLVKVGITLLLLHRFEDSLWSFREALSVRKRAMGSLHPSTARIYNNIGCVHVELNELREARRAFEAALDIQRNALSHDPESGPLLFGTATTLCNLGYLYRYRDLHSKAAIVLKEAVDLQELVLGRSHSTVLSTLDNLADSCANCGRASDALKFYNMVLERFRVDEKSSNSKVIRAEAVLLYKVSRVHRQRNDREAQLDTLKLALRSIRHYSESRGDGEIDTLERRIQHDIRVCREELEKAELKWI